MRICSATPGYTVRQDWQFDVRMENATARIDSATPCQGTRRGQSVNRQNNDDILRMFLLDGWSGACLIR